MELTSAVRLIERGVANHNQPQRWVDLGAGDGLFTQALGTLLPAKSLILAIDQNESAQSIALTTKSVTLQTQVGNFMSLDWGKDWNGILMANALHYVSDASRFLNT